VQRDFLCQVVFQNFCETREKNHVGLLTPKQLGASVMRVDLFALFAHGLRSSHTLLKWAGAQPAISSPIDATIRAVMVSDYEAVNLRKRVN
jgi:hypothetical protein